MVKPFGLSGGDALFIAEKRVRRVTSIIAKAECKWPGENPEEISNPAVISESPADERQSTPISIGASRRGVPGKPPPNSRDGAIRFRKFHHSDKNRDGR